MRSNTKLRNVAENTAVTGVLSAEAIVLSWLESLLPALPFLPPGVKPGLANIIVMFAASALSLPQALCIVIIKSGFVLLTRGLSGAFMSLCGGVLSAIVMYILMKFPKNSLGIIGISILSAISHNAGQFLAASILAGSNLFLAYAPALLIFGILAGILTGILMQTLLPILNKQYKKIIRLRSSYNEK